MIDPAIDFERMDAPDAGQDWQVAWHPPTPVPDGTPHGATAICLAPDRQVVLVRSGSAWSLPGGRPEPGETWEQTLHREVHEEACAQVVRSRLLGYGRGECTRGHERGLILVRSLWLAEVDLLAWQPHWEMVERQPFPVAEALNLVRDVLPGGHKRIITRMFQESGLTHSISSQSGHF